MWDISAGSKIIQIRLGSKVCLAYSSSKRKKNADILIRLIDEMRLQFEQKNIAIQNIVISETSEIPEDCYIVYFGATYQRFDYKNVDIINVLRNLVCQHYLKDNSYEGIRKLFQNGVKHLGEKEYQKSIYEFAQTYYCASFSGDTLDIMINSIINICGIEFLNQQYDSALLSAQRACVLALDGKCYNPYLKYYAAAWAGVVYMQKQELDEAIRHFTIAYDIISSMNENGLMLTVLSTLTQLYMQTQDYLQSVEMIDQMLDILQEDKSLEVENEFIIKLARYQSHAYKVIIKQQLTAYAELSAEYEELSQRVLVRVVEMALNFVYKYGRMFVCIGLGNLLNKAFNTNIGGVMNVNLQVALGSKNNINGKIVTI